jgi:hypothetical protein
MEFNMEDLEGIAWKNADPKELWRFSKWKKIPD